MDKLEYIPGDFISVYVGVKKYIVEVIGTENENEVLSYKIKFPNGEIQYADKDNIVPIPITQKILCKNKWETNDIDYDYSINDKLYFRAFPAERKAGCIELEVYNNIAPSDSYDVCQDDFYLGDISYVHDLQHLLFGLGINHEMEV